MKRNGFPSNGLFSTQVWMQPLSKNKQNKKTLHECQSGGVQALTKGTFYYLPLVLPLKCDLLCVRRNTWANCGPIAGKALLHSHAFHTDAPEAICCFSPSFFLFHIQNTQLFRAGEVFTSAATVFNTGRLFFKRERHRALQKCTMLNNNM